MRVLLDTSFLLPVVGVRVTETASVLHRLWELYKSREVELYYTDFNLLEIAWKLSKLSYDPFLVETGLKSLERNMLKAQPEPSSVLKALELRRRGFRDVIDLLLYQTAKDNGLNFLTCDIALVNFLKNVGEDTSIVITSV